MPPNNAEVTRTVFEEEGDAKAAKLPKKSSDELILNWKIIIIVIYIHIATLYGTYQFFFASMWQTRVFGVVVGVLSGFGVTAGAHRLWCHKSYKAKWQLRMLLLFFNTIACQGSVITWAWNHRMHHKYSETDADPHNAKRGAFFAHVGWLMRNEHEQVAEKRYIVEVGDLIGDPELAFQYKYWYYMVPFISFLFPALVPWYFWGETATASWHVCAIMRYTLALNGTWLINSAAHGIGNRPFEKDIGATDNFTVAQLTLGEGWHNYHHVFPWDYMTSELGHYSPNLTKMFINSMAAIGWAYDMKTVPMRMVLARAKSRGDGSLEEHFWGWDDYEKSLQKGKSD